MKHPVRNVLISGLALSMLAVGPAAASSGSADVEHRSGHSNRGKAQQQRELKVTTFADTADVAPGDGVCGDASGACSLRAAIQTANSGQGEYEISLRKGTYELMIVGVDGDGAEAGDLDVTGRIELSGGGATLDLSQVHDRGFDIASGAELSVDGLTVVGGNPVEESSGGAFRNGGTLELEDVTVSDSVVVGAGASGGAVFNSGHLTVDRSIFTGNSATRAGGAIEANGGTTEIERSTLSGNSTGPMPGNGGALHLTGEGIVTVSRSTVEGNVAASEGGGLWNSATGTMEVSRTTISANVANGEAADNGGGGLFNDGGAMTVTRSSVTGNSAPMGSGSGGGVFNAAGHLETSRTDIVSNSAQRAGGGIETVDGTVKIERSTLSENSTGAAPGNGGAVHASGSAAIVSIARSVVSNNVAALEGGGLWAGAGNSIMTVSDSKITGNTANGSGAANGGGGLFNKGGLLEIDRSEIADNVANVGSGSGGGILNLGTLELSNSKIVDNTSARAGGGLEANDVNQAGNSTLYQVHIEGNSTGAAPGNGGGVHVTGSTITTVIECSVITGNSAANEGGGLWNFENATMTVTGSTIGQNTSPVGPNVFQNGAGGNFTVDGQLVPAGANSL